MFYFYITLNVTADLKEGFLFLLIGLVRVIFVLVA